MRNRAEGLVFWALFFILLSETSLSVLLVKRIPMSLNRNSRQRIGMRCVLRRINSISICIRP